MDTGSARDTAWRAAARTARVIGQHKVISSISALFVVAIIVVSLATGSPAASKSYKTAPNFTLAALGSTTQKVSLTQYAGKPVVVNFFGSWCEPCQKETPLLASWYKQQHGQVVLLGLDESDTVANAEKFVAAKGVTYPIAFDPDVIVPSEYGLGGYPYTFFLNARHQIVYRVIGGVTRADLAKGLGLMNSSS